MVDQNKLAELIALYDNKDFSKYTYDGDLGAIYSAEKTHFKVWSPISTKVLLRLYQNGTPASLGGDDTHTDYLMSNNNGVWECVLLGDLEGKYYTYIVTNPIYEEKEAVDPYAKSSGINGLRGMIVDFSKTNPEGWDDVKIVKRNQSEMVVYETHIADITNSNTWNGNEKNRRLYLGAIEPNTKYKNLSTGFDNIVDLGVNTVQILPIFDQANDERPDDKRNDGTKRTFNWGYDPNNYNVLDGIYSKNPYDGYERIKEFKKLVKAFNKKGINIIMDVVYNHVMDLMKSNFDTIMPGYYFRYKDGKISDASLCGNETASEMPMYKKFMIDSTEFLAKEYKLGGFRFDLMGVHNVETMNALAKNLHSKVNDGIIIYGEPWSAAPTAMKKGFMVATQTALPYYEGYGCFNDKLRDALIKGGLNEDKDLGWVTDEVNILDDDILDLTNGIKGKILKDEEKFDSNKCVNYVTCHDNYTLYDRIKAAGIEDDDKIKKMAMLANAIILTSKGVSFILAGEEFLRTKGGDANSYISSYEVNEINYEWKVNNLDMYKNYQKLISLKKSGIFVDSDINVIVNESKSMISYKVLDKKKGLEYLIIHSNGVVKQDKVMNLEGYKLYLDTLNSNINLTNNTQLQPFQTIICYK